MVKESLTHSIGPRKEHTMTYGSAYGTFYPSKAFTYLNIHDLLS